MDHLYAFVTSLAIGLLIGLERERNVTAKAGVRTFALVALFGAICAMLSAQSGAAWPLAAGLLVVGLLIVAAYFGAPAVDGDPGTTTEAALLVCYGLGAMVWYGYSSIAIMLAIASAALLYFKPELHGISHNMERRDLLSILQFATLSFIVLPILPDVGYGPYQALNPYNIWLMVVLISGISLSGYIALRLVGQRYGAPLLGFMGGMASSTATTLVYARHGRSDPQLIQLAVPVILIANLVVVIRLGVLGAVTAPAILPHLLPALGGALALGLMVTIYWWRKLHQDGDLPMPRVQNPAEIRISLAFGLLYGVVLFLTAWLSDYAGNKGLYAIALVSGLTDVDAITLSSLRLFSLGKLEAQQTVTAIVLALIANLAFKFGLIVFIGGALLAKRCVWGMFALAVGAAAVLWLS
ncbi:MAG: MgtC/SapB family protein [Sulfuricellaceae bacterium]